MGKNATSSNNSSAAVTPDDYELKVLINNCNVCHTNSNISRENCKYHHCNTSLESKIFALSVVQLRFYLFFN